MNKRKKKRGWHGGMKPPTAERLKARNLGYVSTAEAAEIMGVAQSTISSWIPKLQQVDRDRAPTMKVGPFRWVYLASVKAIKPDLEAIAKGVA